MDEFDDWQPLQDVRCELVDGLVFAMTGATFAHDIVVGNLFFELTRRLREQGQPMPALYRRHRLRHRRGYPPAAGCCGLLRAVRAQSDAVSASSLVAELLSPSTEWVDQMAKLAEYRAIPSLHASSDPCAGPGRRWHLAACFG